MTFLKYPHLERFGTNEVEAIEVGTAYVFPKLDGTNASVWAGEDYSIKTGSRNRELSLESDNAGFYAAMLQDKQVGSYLLEYPYHILYGEWLVPHTVKTYVDTAWRKFYVFDVFNKLTGRFIPFTEYEENLKSYGLNYLAPLAIIKNGDIDVFTKCLEKNTVLIKDGEGVGEGIVIKNYDYVNKYGRVTWAKLVTNEFKDKHHKEMGAPLIGCEIVEEKIVNKLVTESLVDKVVAKIITSNDGVWSSKNIPQLINTVFYDLIREDAWTMVKEFKNPTINFKTLSHYTTAKVKELRKDLF
ncbi:RNA ligase domain, REL/Rln2 [uncultured Caudovirales phage]|uniref:RNA ligase domain, REL/Rln2 n=1 Tax=uncultured Caudovirales phage TaxID=2100421 RepID=A0A6J5NGQ2_9CAUD|nr:RNA ligase domain, REL/Rln2 [uncultured Caudovirales phage]CAB4181419.1 RNA ligase domain, REL/Rln2 [uncultured Caudovirales phage]